MTLDDATLDRLARRIAHYLRQADQRRVDAELAAEHRRQVPLKVIEEAAKVPKDAVTVAPWKNVFRYDPEAFYACHPERGAHRHPADAVTPPAWKRP